MKKKIMYTTSFDNIIKSISDICNCDRNNITTYLKDSESFINQSIEEIKLEPFFKNIGLDFKNKNELYNLIKFDSSIICHLTSRINEPDKSDIYCLTRCFLQSTDISNFLSDNGITFKKNGDSLITYLNNETIDWDNFHDSRANRIKVRLRIRGKYIDNCINGFLFNDYFWQDSNIEHINDCPEIMRDMCTLLHREDVINEWKNISKSYALGFLADIKDIIFDNYTNCNTVKSKIYLTYKFVLYYLIQKYHNKWNPRHDNTIIRLNDNYSVDKENIIGFYEIER